jgi:hypothetical protein
MKAKTPLACCFQIVLYDPTDLKAEICTCSLAEHQRHNQLGTGDEGRGCLR